MKIRKMLLLLLIATSSISAAYGQEIPYSRFGMETKDAQIPEGLKPGDKAPFFTGYDQFGKTVDLK